MSREDEHHPVARAGRRHELLLVLDVHELRGARGPRHDASAPSGLAEHRSARLRAEQARRFATTTATIRPSRRAPPTPAWAWTINVTRPVGGREHGGDPGPRPRAAPAPPTSRSSRAGARCARALRAIEAGDAPGRRRGGGRFDGVRTAAGPTGDELPGPPSIDSTIARGAAPDDAWRAAARARRDACPWVAAPRP